MQPDALEVAGGPVPDIGWIAPGKHGTPAEALKRIGAICVCVPDLFGALLAVLATHQGVSRPILGAAIKQHRSDLDDISKEDVSVLLVSIWSGGRPGFDAVLRSRRKGDRKAMAFPWGQE